MLTDATPCRIATVAIAFVIADSAVAKDPQEFTNTIGMAFRLIPAGEFTAGSAIEDHESPRDEHPQHHVRITNPFFLGITEVTQDQFERIVGRNPSRIKGEAHPVAVRVADAEEFCRKLSAKEGKTYRLPTEAEWEYACRARSTTKWYFGDNVDDLKDHAWFAENAGNTTHAVGQKMPNPWGLYDLYGNVAELCSDRYADDYYTVSPVNDPKGPVSGPTVVIRGGMYCLVAEYCRSAYRGLVVPPDRDDTEGFRIVCELDPVTKRDGPRNEDRPKRIGDEGG